MSDVRAHAGVPTTANFAGLTTPSACAPLVVDSDTGVIYALKTGDVVVGGGSGTVTSVAETFTGGIISVAGSPITTSGTLALTVAGTSGGIPYFSSGTAWASSAELAASAIVLGGGAGVAPATTTTGTGVVTALGVNVGTVGAFVVNGGVLGTPSSGTVTNLTGTASININGTVGATTPTTGAFTTASASGQITSTVTTGTAPLVIASTTKVTNLNADLLDDQTGSYYLDSANFTGTNWTDLTDGGTTTLHTHTSGVASSITVANEATDTSCFIIFTTAATGDLGPKSNAGLTFNSATAMLTATGFTGPLTGNASTATALQTARTIGGTSFDGTANIVPSTITIANEATDTSCSIAFFTAATGDLQPKTNANLTFNSNTGVLTSASLVATTADINGGTVDNAAIGGSTASTGAFTTISASGQITSTVATGSAPLVIASTTKVTNLNADLLDDQTGSYYLDSDNFTGTEWTDLTDAGETTLHIHAATGVTNFHALIAAHVALRA